VLGLVRALELFAVIGFPIFGDAWNLIHRDTFDQVPIFTAQVPGQA
jgi:hypothetical protein